MSRRRIEFFVYLVGLAPLGLLQAQARAIIGNDAVAFGAAVAYLLILRLLGRVLSRRLSKE